MKKTLNVALLVSFVMTIMVPLTGVHIHKLASVVFLLLSGVHAVIYRMKLGRKTVMLISLVIVSFASGLFGLILEQYPVVLILHRCLSIGIVFFMAIHIFVHHRKL